MRNLYGSWKSYLGKSVYFASIFTVWFAASGFSTQLRAQTLDTLWSENWEGEWVNDWYVDGGTWEVGVPTSGPGNAFAGSNCGATVLAGNYSEGVRSRFIRFTKFTVPAAKNNPRLRFWHWFSFSSADYGYVQIKTEQGDWENISPQYSGVSSSVWTYPSIDLSAFADSVVQIAFYFHSDNQYGGGAEVSSGWYIDNVVLLSGPITYYDFEDFEAGIGDWSADRGTWEVGLPESGPGSAYSGSVSAATRLDNNYSEGVRSSLISPEFLVPPIGENPRLRFWHWFSFSSADFGYVQIKTESGEWTNISPQYRGVCSGVWTYPSIDLSAYADSVVQIAFYFQSDNQYGGGAEVSSGWYIDDVKLVSGPVTFNEFEDFEDGIGDWNSDRGTWEVGIPESGPGSAYSGSVSAATRLDNNYSEGVRSSLISPEFLVPPIGENPRLRFWHWFSFSSADFGYVQIKTENGGWKNISSQYTGVCSSVWTYPSIDLSAYADSVVQIAFYFQSDNQYGGGAEVSSGWYLDDIKLVTGPYIINELEGFEGGIGDWSVDRGTWEVGISESGPQAPYSGELCAGTQLAGNYSEGIRSRLVSPPIRVKPLSENPNLRFWHWYSFSSADFGEVHIKTDNSEWQILSNRFSSTSSGIYTTFYADLSSYADSLVQIGFYFHSDNQYGGGAEVSSGWYIDEINMPAVINHYPLLTNPIPDTTITENDQTFPVVQDLNYVFYDPDPGDSLNFSVSTDNPELIPEINSDTLLLTATKNFTGEANISVTATDRQGLSVSDTFKVDIVTEIIDQDHVLPKYYNLAQNYPNPFNPLTTIKYQLPRTTGVDLSIYNSLGQKVATLINQHQTAGYYSVNWNAGDLASGLYFIRLQAEGFVKVKKTILVR